MILSRAPVRQWLHSLCLSISARTKFGLHRVFQQLDLYVTSARLKFPAICPWPLEILAQFDLGEISIEYKRIDVFHTSIIFS